MHHVMTHLLNMMLELFCA